VSLGQGDSQTDWPKYTPPRSATLPGIRNLYDRCDQLARSLSTRHDVAEATAPFEVRVSGRFEPAERETPTLPGYPAHFCVEGVHLPKDIHAQALANFVRMCADAGYSRAQIEPLLEIAHGAISYLCMDQREDELERMTKQIEDENPHRMQN
jgi:exopolyphosphatase/pppGpp-phosphohydrolase